MWWPIEITTSIILLILQTSNANPNKSTAPAVFEVINEQARIDDKRTIPYENPLAGNSLRNARLHAQHQQAMFNAEKVRQHQAQIMRWNHQPPKQQVDSYMKAYHESQENHHHALEQIQSNMKEKKVRVRPEQKRTLKDSPQIEPSKITRADSITKSRNHRSFGSVHPYLLRKHKIYTYPGPTYDQGVTIKPNGNIGLTNYEKEVPVLFTEAIPSKTQYAKTYSQMNAYEAANDISILSNLLNRQPGEELTHFDTLTRNEKETDNNALNTPIDLFFYHKHPQLVNEESVNSYPGSYAAEYINQKDHTPITEEVDDIKDNRDPRVKIAQPVPTPLVQISSDATTTKNNDYIINVHTVISDNVNKNLEHTVQENPSYIPLKYEKPLTLYSSGPSAEGIKYLRTQSTGVQHLNQDGTGVSAYGADDVSIKITRTKREIDTSLFIFENYTLTTEKNIDDKNVQSILNKTLINLEVNCTLSIQNINDTLTGHDTFDYNADGNESLPTPKAIKRNRNFQLGNIHNIGEAYDYDYSYDEDEFDIGSKFDYVDENDYDPDYESTIPDYDYNGPRPRPGIRPNRPRTPDKSRNIEISSGFSNRFSKFRLPDIDDYHPEPINREYNDQYERLQYGPSNQFGLPSTSYGQPIIQQYSPPIIHKPQSIPNFQYGASTVAQVSNVVNSLQPVYMLTHDQLKELVSSQKLNIEHLDVFQLPRDSMPKSGRHRYTRQQKRNYRRRFPKKGRKYKLGRIRKLNKIIRL